MLTFLRVKLALLPLPLWLVAAGLQYPLAGAVAGLLWAVGWLVLAVRSGRPVPPFILALAIGLGLVVIGLAVPVPVLQAKAVVMACLGLGAAASVALGRPWTVEFSASDYDGMTATPLFRAINTQISSLWAAVFLWLAAAEWAALPPWAQWGPLAAAGLVSVLLPKVLVARGLQRMAAGNQRNAWDPPRFAVGHATREGCDVAVVGAGLGGLTAAALLADAGLKVQVFEQHVLPGGFAHNWLRRARTRDPVTDRPLVFRFDSGVHDVSGWYPGGTVHSVFDRLGIACDSEWKRLDHRYLFDGQCLDVPRDWNAYAGRLADLHPHEAAGIRALFQDIHAVHVAMFSTAAARGGIPGSPGTAEALMAFARAHPLAAAWMGQPWHAFVRRHVRDPKVGAWIDALGGYITEDTGRALVSDMVPIYGYYFHGGYYPVGGSGQMAESLVAAIERRGGQVHLKSPVRRILQEDGAACGVLVGPPGRERRVAAQAVVCNADLGATLDTLLDDPRIGAELRAQVGGLQPACSAVGVSLGLRGALDLPPVVHVSGPEGGVGMVIPSAVDPGCAPEGYAVVELLELVAGEEARAWLPEGAGIDPARLEAWRHSEAYLARKQAMGDRLIARAAQAIPDIAERIVYRTDATPVTFQRYAWTSGGSIYGMRAGQGRVPTRTPLRNLVLAGAATHGPGVEAVVISGAYAAEALLPGVLAPRARQEELAPVS